MEQTNLSHEYLAKNLTLPERRSIRRTVDLISRMPYRTHSTALRMASTANSLAYILKNHRMPKTWISGPYVAKEHRIIIDHSIPLVSCDTKPKTVAR